MEKTIIAAGDIIRDAATGTRRRVIAIADDSVILCTMGINKLELDSFSYSGILDLIFDGEAEFEEEEPFVFDVDALSGSVRAKYEIKRLVMNRIEAEYGPTFLGLTGKKSKPELKAILEEYGMDAATFWRSLIKYLQNGRQPYSLVDPKAFGLNRGKQYSYNQKPGRKGEYFRSEVIVDDTVAGYFDEAIKWATSGRKKSLTKAYERMISLHYKQHVIRAGHDEVLPLPETQCPSLKQFFYYAHKKVSKEEWDKIRTSAQEVRNDERLLPSDALYGVHGPGDLVEIDACEADVSLVSLRDRNRTVGRPIVYFMVDVYTYAIVSVSVSFENNSLLGVTNLFLNQGEDKREYCSRYGIQLDDETLKLWPSGFVPRRVRTDRGAEFKSKEFTRICTELGIEKMNVPGATGSYKGLVEQEFHEMHSNLNPVLEDYGLIEKRYDSEHHKEATLNIDEYTAMVINFVLAHNQKVFSGYPRTKDMMDNNVLSSPAILWQYGVRKYGEPRPIPSIQQYMYTLMMPIKASFSRKGILWRGLWYYTEDDPKLLSEMYRAGNKRESIEVRMDPRCVGAVYYIRDNRLIRVPLNPRRTGNADFSYVSMQDWKDYYKEIKRMNAEGRMFDMMLEGALGEINEAILAGAKKDSYSNAKDMRPARKSEKSRTLSAGKMENRLSGISEDDAPAGLPDSGAASGTPNDDRQKGETETERYTDVRDAFRKHRNS